MYIKSCQAEDYKKIIDVYVDNRKNIGKRIVEIEIIYLHLRIGGGSRDYVFVDMMLEELWTRRIKNFNKSKKPYIKCGTCGRKFKKIKTLHAHEYDCTLKKYWEDNIECK